MNARRFNVFHDTHDVHFITITDSIDFCFLGPVQELVDQYLVVGHVLEYLQYMAFEFIIIDDGSTDRTPEIVRSFPDVRLIQHPVNKGYGAAIKCGFEFGRGAWRQLRRHGLFSRTLRTVNGRRRP